MLSNKVKEYLSFTAIFLNVIFLIIITILINSKLNNNSCENKSVDYQMKDIFDNCYLTIHNFVSINTSVVKNDLNNIIQNKHSFKTYLYGYTKPYLIELVQNNTKDCLCCN